MPERTPSGALAAFKDWLQRAVSCVSRLVLRPSPEAYRATDREHSLAFPERAAPLRGNTPALLVVKIGFRLTELGPRSWEAAITSYHYALEDQGEREILAYHWHPHIAQIALPHVHLGPGAAVGRAELRSAHLPTGRVELRDIVLLAVRDFGVTPLRDD